MKQTLSARRLWFLVRSDFLSGYRVAALFAGTTAGIVFLISLSEGFGVSQDRWFHREHFGYILFIWGIWVTSRAFRPLHDRTLREAYLLLPASSLEKLLARLFAVDRGSRAVPPDFQHNPFLRHRMLQPPLLRQPAPVLQRTGPGNLAPDRGVHGRPVALFPRRRLVPPRLVSCDISHARRSRRPARGRLAGCFAHGVRRNGPGMSGPCWMPLKSAFRQRRHPADAPAIGALVHCMAPLEGGPVGPWNLERPGASICRSSTRFVSGSSEASGARVDGFPSIREMAVELGVQSQHGDTELSGARRPPTHRQSERPGLLRERGRGCARNDGNEARVSARRIAEDCPHHVAAGNWPGGNCRQLFLRQAGQTRKELSMIRRPRPSETALLVMLGAVVAVILTWAWSFGSSRPPRPTLTCRPAMGMPSQAWTSGISGRSKPPAHGESN